MSKYYSAEFKMEAVKRVQKTGDPVARIAAELGVNENTLHGWIKRSREKPDTPFPGSGKLSAEDERLRKLESSIIQFQHHQANLHSQLLLAQVILAKRPTTVAGKSTPAVLESPACS